MSTTRDLIVSALTDTFAGLGLTNIKVMPYARQIDPPDTDVVMVRVDEVRPSAAAGGWLDYDIALVCVGANADPTGPGDDALDGLLADVLDALDSCTQLVWSKATRATYGPTPETQTNPAYEVSTTTTNTKAS